MYNVVKVKIGGDFMPASAARLRANAKWDKKAYDKILLRLPKGKKDIVLCHIAKQGQSLNGFINRAIDDAMQNDSDKSEGNE